MPIGDGAIGRTRLIAELVVAHPPRGKQRPRTVKLPSGGVTTYTPDKTATFEEAVRQEASKYLSGRLEGALAVHVEAISPRPKRLCRRKDPDGLIPSKAKPDGDNVIKAIADAMASWFDDSQVHEWLVRKWYSERGGSSRCHIYIFEV